MPVSEAMKKSIERYDKKNTVQVHLKLNRNTDRDILERLQSVEGKQTYIKRLIREDLKKEGTKMTEKVWVLIDDCTTKAAVFWGEPLQVETKEEAVKEARRRWESLTKHDQDKRDAFYICLCGYDEEGLIDLETMEECEYIK